MLKIYIGLHWFDHDKNAKISMQFRTQLRNLIYIDQLLLYEFL